jgi:hypothetical protein
MSSTHEDKSNDKPRQRGRKASQRGQRTGRQGAEDQIDSIGASTEVPGSGTAAQVEQALIGEVEPATAVVIENAAATEDTVATEEVAAAAALPTVVAASAGENQPVNMQTIANAYRDYTRKLLQANGSFVEQLMSVRSLDRAVEVQTDYATQAYANFVAESQKICGLYSELARQALSPRKASLRR